jgi:hypothetical protein
VIQWPPSEKMTRISSATLDRFKKTAAIKELEQDSREWTLVTWSWMPDPPYALTFRSSDMEERYCVMEEDGRWQMRVIRPARSVA